MSSGYRDMLVHVDDTKGAPARIELAAGLAARFEAHLTGLWVDPGIQLPMMVEAPPPVELIEALESERVEREAKAKASWESLATKAGIETEWRSSAGEVSATVQTHGRYADLVIVGQQDDDQAYVVGGLPDTLAIGLGRPLLIVPYIGARATLGQRVLIAWNGSREAARAVNDALPLLEGADEVTVLTVNPNTHRSGDLPGADICLHLARHGVRAQAAHSVASDIDAGDMLLSRASDTDADLIVMGAYGHSRMRELVLGGVTRALLEQMTVPVLMSH